MSSGVTLDPLTCDFWQMVHAFDMAGRDILREGCDCGSSPAEYHLPTCATQGIYGDLCGELDVWPVTPHGARWNMEGWWPMNYVCQGRAMYSSFHTLGEINGPGHWCEREKRWVDQGE